jgi:hypothetical protein
MATMKRVILAVSAWAVLAAPPPLEAQSRWREQVNGQITAASRTLQDRGYSRTHDIYDGSLDHEENEFLTLTLRAGVEYQILAVCDVDCSDLDLRIYDEDNKEIDSDIETDDVPIVSITPAHNGKFRLKVIMAKCTTSPCFYGVGVFGK